MYVHTTTMQTLCVNNNFGAVCIPDWCYTSRQEAVMQEKQERSENKNNIFSSRNLNSYLKYENLHKRVIGISPKSET